MNKQSFLIKGIVLLIHFFCIYELGATNQDRFGAIEQRLSTLEGNPNKPQQKQSFLSKIAAPVITTGLIAGSVALFHHIFIKDSIPQQNTPIPQPVYTFKNLAGKIPLEVLEISDFIKNPSKYSDMGASMPRGVLLVGPPGTGKSSIARAFAGEVQAHFFTIAATQFINGTTGHGPAAIRQLFDNARNAVKAGPYKKAIIFIDELDAIGNARNAVNDSGGLEFRNTLNELLYQMDGFYREGSLMVLAATNRHQDLDTALTRPGRFDRIIKIGLPDAESREAILMHYAQKIKKSTHIDFKKLGTLTAGMSGADLENVVNEAVIFAIRENSVETTHEHFEKVLDKHGIKKL